MSPAQRAALAKEVETARLPAFRAFLESQDYCGLALSPLIAAIADASEGRLPDTITDAQSEKHFGCKRAALPRKPPRTVAVRAGGRGGKTSRLHAPKALHAAWTVPVPLLGKGEEAYAILVAPTMRLARQGLSFCRGYVENSPRLSSALISDSADHLSLRRPDGRAGRIEIFAAGRGGAQLRAKTLVYAGFDEAAFFRDESTGVVNDAELYRAVLQRIVPGGQCWLPTTPWLAGVGLVEEIIARDFGVHEHALCVVAPTRDLNPSWDPTGEIEADLREQDPDAAEREIDAIPMAGGTALFFSHDAIEDAADPRRPLKLERKRGMTYAAGGDCGFKKNSSALVIVERDGERFKVAHIEEIKPRPGLPLKPGDVVDQFATALSEYGVGELAVDSHERDEVSKELEQRGMSAVSAPDKVESYILARKLLHEGKIELPRHPRLRSQLRAVTSKPRPGGGVTISSPRSADGSHGDLVSALVVAIWRAAQCDAGSYHLARSGRRR